MLISDLLDNIVPYHPSYDLRGDYSDLKLSLTLSAGRDLQKMLTRLRGSVGGDSFAEAWSRESPLICLAPGVKLTDTEAETVRSSPSQTYHLPGSWGCKHDSPSL